MRFLPIRKEITRFVLRRKWGEWYSTATKRRVLKLGKTFFDSFPSLKLKGKKRIAYSVSGEIDKDYWSLMDESPASISLRQSDVNLKKNKVLTTVYLGFQKNNLIVEGIKGGRKVRSNLDVFSSIHKKNAFDFLFDLIEEHAKKTGFVSVKIRVPETLQAYYAVGKKGLPEQEVEAIRKRMIALYERLAEARGFTRKGDFYVKEL